MKALTLLSFAVLFVIVITGCSRDDDTTHMMGSMATVGVGSINGQPGQYCTELFAGQTIDAGDVCLVVNDYGESEELCITYTTTDGWVLIETHAWVGEDLADMPQTRKGNPVVGNFPYHSGDITGETSYTVCIDLNQFGTEGGVVDLCDLMLYAATHAVVARDLDGDGVYDEQETAWGDGDRMVDKGNWATYFTVILSCEVGGGGGETGETAFAYDCDGNANCFIDIDEDGDGIGDFNRWGWSNGPLGPGTYYFDIYAGAGQCDITKGVLVGLLTVEYDGATASVTYNTCGTYLMDEVHLYVGDEILARDVNGDFTVAPGQYPYIDDDIETNSYTFVINGLSGDIYVVAHAVVVGDYSQGDCGTRGCVPPCVPGFDYDGFAAEIHAAESDNTKIKVQYPYGGGPAYFPTTYIDYDGDGVAEVTTQSWCVDTDNTIAQNWYCANLYSSYEDLGTLVEHPENMDLVNYILNQGYVGQASPGGYGTYTYGDVQRAIWSLVEDNNSTSGLGSWSQARVDEIIADATANGEAYEPPCDGVAGVILSPVNCDGTGQYQVLIAQVLVAEYPAICNVCP